MTVFICITAWLFCGALALGLRGVGDLKPEETLISVLFGPVPLGIVLGAMIRERIKGESNG